MIGARERDRHLQEVEQPSQSMAVRGSTEWLERGLVVGEVIPARQAVTGRRALV